MAATCATIIWDASMASSSSRGPRAYGFAGARSDEAGETRFSRKLKSAGFSRFKQVNSPSTPETKDKVIGTNPPANQTSAITNEIAVIVGSGPSSKQVPDVAGQTADEAQKNLTVYGFSKFAQASVDSPARPAP